MAHVAGIAAGILVGSLVLPSLSCMALAQEVAQFYKGQTVTIVIGSSAGGGYDLYGR